MKKTLLLMCAMIASIGAWAQNNVTNGKTVVPLGGVKTYTYTGDDGTTTNYTISNDDLQKITVDGNTANVYLFPEEEGKYNTDANKAIGIQGFYIDLGSAQAVSNIQTTWEGAAASYKVYLTDTEPAADGTLTSATEIADYTNSGQETTKNVAVSSDATGRYIVCVPQVATNYGWGVKIRTFVAIDKYTPELTTLNVTASATRLNVNGTATITASALDQSGTAVEGAEISYESSNTSVATVTAEGTVTAVSLGTATITVKAKKGDKELTQIINFIVEEPFAAPATIATEPTADAENVIAIFSQKYGKTDKKDNNPAWGGGPNPLWTSFEDVVISEHTLKHVVGTGYADRPASEITADYSKAFVALYPKSATSGKLYADGGYAAAETFTLTPGEWNYIQVPFAKATNYVAVELVGEIEFYLDHFYVVKPVADALDITLGSNGKATVTGPLNATNKSELNVDAYAEAVAFDLTGATVAEGTGAVETKSANAVVIANQTDETKLAGTKNLCHLTGEWMVFAKNGETAPTVTFTDNAPVYTGSIYSKDNDVTFNYSRTFTGYATFSFPAAVEIPTGVTAYTFTKYADNQVSFTKVDDEVTTLTKNTPYVLHAASEATISYSGSATTENGLDMRTAGTATDNGATFTANYNVLTTDGEQYILSGDQVKKGNGAKVGAFRAYFTGVAGAANSRIYFIDNEAMKIGAVDANGNLNVGEFYNLRGQRVQNPVKGLYIVNGKKVVLK